MLALWAGTAMAQAPSPDQVRALQYALNRIDRYPSGPVDGIIGPLTRGAVATYAGSRPLEAAFWPVAGHLAQLVWWRAPWDDATEQAVRTALDRITRGPGHTLIRGRRVWKGRSTTVACALIRDQGGPRWLYFPLRIGYEVIRPNAPPTPVLRADPPVPVPRVTSALWCDLGYLREP